MSKVQEFFASHPEANEVHEALGRLFTEKDKAQQFLAGVQGQIVVTHTRDGIEYAKPSEQLKHAVLVQENIVDAYQVKYEHADGADKEKQMQAWKAEQQKLADLKYKLGKQLKEEAKDEAIEESKPVVKTPAEPVVEEPTAPVVEEPTASVVEEPTASVVEEPTAPVVEESTETVVEEPTETVVEEPTETVVEEPTAPVVEEKDKKNAGKGKGKGK